MSMRRSRLAHVLLLALVACALAATSAQAGVLVQSAGTCEARTTTQVFLPWLDPLNYAAVPGGGFENGAAGWTLARASVVSGNETYDVGGSGDGSSLSLPAGSSATSPVICVGLDGPVLRLFARNGSSLLSTLRVDVRFEDASGATRTLTVGLVVGSRTWKPTLPMAVVANLLPLLPGQTTPIAFTFTPLGAGGDWRIDDVFIDPRRGH
jgi:hypothetical protein